MLGFFFTHFVYFYIFFQTLEILPEVLTMQIFLSFGFLWKKQQVFQFFPKADFNKRLNAHQHPTEQYFIH